MSAKRRKIQLELAFMAEARGEAPSAVHEVTETLMTERGSGSPAEIKSLMERVCERTNLIRAYRKVKSNKGSPGVDGITVGQLSGFIRRYWPKIRASLLEGTYKPKPVKRVEIPKPGGGVRKLGIPTALDRLIQQALLQVLQPQWDPAFSDHSYGFRPGRSAHQAVRQAQEYIAQGCRVVVDMDLEKFFDRVNHDMLMSRVAKRVKDKRVLKLIRGFLNAGVLENGLVSPTGEGTPQGGPLSPLLSNLMLDDLDRELERRGHRFARYADDCNIYVRSKRAGERVMESVTRFITQRLKLKVNAAKSAVARPGERKFLGFSFTNGEQPRRRLSPQTVERFKTRVRKLTRRNRKASIEQVVRNLRQYLIGWLGYFGCCETPSVLRDLESWIRRRLRSILWKQWDAVQSVAPAGRREDMRGYSRGLFKRAMAHGS
ncbi:MAG: group II intron reverse transcriptase/maturase [bacterium]|nr:MAG: group II intron reverse transcriptase/maturase [bacterium]